MSKMTASSPTSKNAQDERSNAQFPWKLHELLTQAEKNGNDSIISWLPGTDAFKVHNKQKFATEILPVYFNATKYKSFQRNLNLWGFETISEGPNKGGCYHKLFLRHDREKCHYMTRQKVKGNKVKQESPTLRSSSPDADTSANLSSLPGLASSEKASNSQAQVAASPQPVGSETVSNDLKQLPFPRKLHHFLSRAEFEDCMAWTPDGRCIRVVDPFRFQEKVAPLYFSHSSFSSFLVELESYGFKKISHAGFQECYYHDMVIRGCHHLCKYLSTPAAARQFVSEDPHKDLVLDPPTPSVSVQASHVERGGPGGEEALSTNLSHLAGLLPRLQASEEMSRLHQQQQLHEQQRQAIAGLDPLLQFIQGGHSLETSAAAAAAQSHNFLRSLVPPLLAGDTQRASLPSQAISSLMSSSSTVDNGQNRSAIAAFLSNRASADGSFRNTGGPGSLNNSFRHP